MNINYEFETIAAIATPLGTGGVGIIRISGERAFEITEKMFSLTIDGSKHLNAGKYITDGYWTMIKK